jgi:Kef-type K+ transport system membrane component KefB
MSSFLQLALSLTVILLAAKLAGYLATRLGQPSVLGELLVGLLLGPSLFDLTHQFFVTDSRLLGEVINQLGELSVLLLMFLAGLELHLSELKRNARVSALAGALGVSLPLALGWAAGRLFGSSDAAAFCLGLAIAATSVSISAQTLMEMKLLRSQVGLGLLGAAVFDDVLTILLLSVFLAVLSGGQGGLAILWSFGRILLFLALAAGFGLWLLPRLVRTAANLPISQGLLTLAVVLLLTFALAAELVGGMAAITGAFVAGLMLARTPEKARFESGVHALAYGLFVPIFFVSIGLSIDLRQMTLDAFWLLLVVLVAAVLGKTLGAGLGARLGGFSRRSALQLGVGMISRGEVSLVVASLGVKYGLLTPAAFSAIVALVLVSTLLTPPLLRAVFPPVDSAPAQRDNQV